MSVRPLVEADLPQVVNLYWRFMRRREGSAPAELRPLFRELYFENPWVDSAYPSLVYEGNDGDIIGFLGIIARKMSLGGQPLRVAFGGNFIVRPESRSNLAAPRLLGAYLAGKYDLWQTDSANDISRKLLERLKFRTIPALNIHWIRALRPSRYAVYALTRGSSPLMSATLKVLSTPFCSVADGVAAVISANPFHLTESSLHGTELDVETLYECLVEFRKDYSFWAEYDVNALTWLLGFMEHRPARGKLRKVAVRDEKQKIVGWYMYYVKPGSVGEVVQVGGDKKYTKAVLQHLFLDAREQGVIGLHGVVDRRHMADFSDSGCFFTCRGGWNVAYSRKPEILDALERGDALLTRLDGEWCLDPGD